MATGAVECAVSGDFRHLFAVECAVAFNAVTICDGLMHTLGLKIDVFMAFNADLSNSRTSNCRFVR